MKNSNMESEYILNDGTVIKLAANADDFRKGSDRQDQIVDHRKERMHAYAEHLTATED